MDGPSLATLATVTGKALWPALEQPDEKFIHGKPVFRLKLSVSLHEARRFYVMARDKFRLDHPKLDAACVILPIRRARSGELVILAETYHRPQIVAASPLSIIAHGDPVRIRGGLYTFRRDRSCGVNLRLSRVERLPNPTSAINR